MIDEHDRATRCQRLECTTCLGEDEVVRSECLLRGLVACVCRLPDHVEWYGALPASFGDGVDEPAHFGVVAENGRPGDRLRRAAPALKPVQVNRVVDELHLILRNACLDDEALSAVEVDGDNRLMLGCFGGMSSYWKRSWHTHTAGVW